jgi:hypothetical protein
VLSVGFSTLGKSLRRSWGKWGKLGEAETLHRDLFLPFVRIRHIQPETPIVPRLCGDIAPTIIADVELRQDRGRCHGAGALKRIRPDDVASVVQFLDSDRAAATSSRSTAAQNSEPPNPDHHFEQMMATFMTASPEVISPTVPRTGWW